MLQALKDVLQKKHQSVPGTPSEGVDKNSLEDMRTQLEVLQQQVRMAGSKPALNFMPYDFAFSPKNSAWLTCYIVLLNGRVVVHSNWCFLRCCHHSSVHKVKFSPCERLEQALV